MAVYIFVFVGLFLSSFFQKQIPIIPSSPSPLNNKTNQPITLTLTWECSDPNGDKVSYDIYFGTTIDELINVSSNKIERTLSRSDLSYGTTYYWRVI